MACGSRVEVSRAQRHARVARRASIALVALAVLILHAGLLDVIARREPADRARAPTVAAPAGEFRTLVAQAVQHIEAPPEPATIVDRTAISTPPSVVDRPVVAQRRPRAAAVPARIARVEVAVEPEAARVVAPVHEDAPALVAQPAPAVYRTAVAPSVQLRYRVERGDLVGSAELSWQVQDGTYEARLDIVYEGSQRMALRRVSQVSLGRIDAAGIAPQRHTARRPRAGMQAVNFEREAGAVSFSGPSWRLALAEGAQDGLSWMLQLAAVAEAEPERATAGGEIVLTVVGIRGEARPWRFRFEPTASGQEGASAVVSDKWVREPSEPYDARLEVWLDPARHHLPLRLRSAAAASNRVLEMVLVE